MNTQQDMKEAAALPGWFKDFPAGKAFLKEKADGILKHRTAARKEIDRLQKEAAGLIPAMKATITDAETELELLEDHRRELLIKYGEAVRALSAVRYGLDRGIQKQEAILFETRDPAIDEAIEYFREETRKLRLPSAIRQSTGKGEKNPANNKQEIVLRTNRAAVIEAINYSRAAIEELEAMKLHPECDAERIEALKGIPSIDVYIESEAYAVAMPD